MPAHVRLAALRKQRALLSGATEQGRQLLQQQQQQQQAQGRNYMQYVFLAIFAYNLYANK